MASHWRNEGERARACRTLLETVRKGDLWTSRGPTDEAERLRDAVGGSYLTRYERVVLLAAFALWDGSGGLTLAEILDELDEHTSISLCQLVIRGHVAEWPPASGVIRHT